MKFIRFIEFSKDDSKCFLNYDKYTQIFTFSKIPKSLCETQDKEIYDKLEIKSQLQNFEIIRMKKLIKTNQIILVISSNNSIEKNRHYLSLSKFVC